MKDINKKSRTFCYCGQSGDEKLNMLHCVKCKRWLHEECVKSLDIPMLLGDRFYILICSECNAGSECLARVQLTWCDILHLVLYNLSVTYKKKYFDLDECIIPFIVDNWERLRLFGPVVSVKSEDRRNKILEALLKDSKRFKSGREIKKSKNIFGLRLKVPPEAPIVQHSAKVKNDVIVWEFLVKGRRYQILTSKKSKSTKETTENGKSKVKLQTVQSHSKDVVSKCRGGLPYNENGIHKTKNRAKHTSTSPFNEESACEGLLDSLIPVPPNFTLENNPFLHACKTRVANRTNPQSRKRRLNGEHVFPKVIRNDDHKLPSNSKLLQKNNSEMFYDAKDFLSHTAKKDDVSVIGKRVTNAGKVQYLLQQNRENVEYADQAKDRLFTITIRCDCRICTLRMHDKFIKLE
ncbi:metal-response element-binding transcription factor 2 [Trichonephila clavata]|uniref:Metal-response element-binding transcription factor 2 n=1 Tax=Trichonephila clavata TaxID=2740835 RepID=A0A8X6FWU0_TRICU|nr:metal-response element-binding transcription factor 2 [Trichonephila clavata]